MEFSKSIIGAAAGIGLLVSATSIINLFFTFFSMHPANWLQSWLNAYQILFHPILDTTIGRLADFFGYHLLSATKDGMVLYVAFGSALVRMARDEGPIARATDILTMLLLWPTFIFGWALDSRRMKAGKQRAWHADMKMHAGSELVLSPVVRLRSFWREVSKVGLIVLASMIANSAGVFN